VHRPDLPLYDNASKVGLGLWNYPIVASLLEVATLFGGMYLYLKATKPVSATGRYAMVIFGVVMVAIQSVGFFGPPPPSDKAVAIEALIFYFFFAGIAYWLERQRAAQLAGVPS
jgi:hypothetical protein